MEDRIGMHNHRVGAKNSLSDFFSECLENNIKTVAITDHKTLKTYIEEFPKLTAEDRDKFRRIKIIIGLEMTGMYEYTNIAGQKHKIAMDILGYNLDLSKHDLLDKLVSQNYVFTDSPEFQRKELERLIAVAKTLGFEADYDNMHISKEEKLAARILSYGLIDPKYKDYNLSKGMLPELIINPRVFFNRYCKNPDSPFYLEQSGFNPQIATAIDIIHKCGGNVVFPHTAAYHPKAGNEMEVKYAWEDSEKFTKDFVSEYGKELKGIEVIHPSYLGNVQFEQFLRETVKENGLYVTGGTDYHQPGEKIAQDTNGMWITKDRLPGLDEWIKTYTIDDIEKMVQKISKEER